MRRFALAAFSLVAICGTAAAADLSRPPMMKAPEPPPYMGWSAKLEYLYLDLGRHTTTWTLAGALRSIVDDARLTMNVVCAGLNYRC